ncbi:MAG: S24 family peptidase [Sphingobium sp.]|uniref:S24 family peptidase n=1 Tax=Sphingobium sp. TaxID=1912891 RepID=UPI0029BA953A|nr:S24 family peptidase [Sphingobium sp.]MDX3910727.1 S24 family peptidase [Sphingobium sp.]
MNDVSARHALDRLIAERRERYEALSRLIGRNPAYIQQYIKRGTPRKLDEADRRTLARYFGVDERLLGGPEEGRAQVPVKKRSLPIVTVPRLSLGASAGVGSLDDDERASGAMAFDAAWLRDMGVKGDALSIIRVDGESMAPTLNDGDDIMVDGADGAARLRDGIYVLRLDDVLMVKRVAMGPKRGRFSVRSDNPHFPNWDDIDPGLVDIVGRVIWTGRRVG